MSGRAMFTIVMSSRSMNVATDTAVSVHHFRSTIGILRRRGRQRSSERQDQLRNVSYPNRAGQKNGVAEVRSLGHVTWRFVGRGRKLPAGGRPPGGPPGSKTSVGA